MTKDQQIQALTDSIAKQSRELTLLVNTNCFNCEHQENGLCGKSGNQQIPAVVLPQGCGHFQMCVPF